MVKRNVVGAHYGITGWLMQRITAAIMALFSFIFLITVLSLPHMDFKAWKALFSHGWLKTGMALFFLSLFLHAWIGMRDILMDYVHPTGMRLALQVFVILSLAAGMIRAMTILWGR